MFQLLPGMVYSAPSSPAGAFDGPSAVETRISDGRRGRDPGTTRIAPFAATQFASCAACSASMSFFLSSSVSTGGETADRQLVDLAGEGERDLIVGVVDRRAGVEPMSKVSSHGRSQRNVRSIVCVATTLPSTDERARAGAADAAHVVERERREAEPVILEVVDERVLARGQRVRPLPLHPLEVEQVPGEDRLALQR